MANCAHMALAVTWTVGVSTSTELIVGDCGLRSRMRWSALSPYLGPDGEPAPETVASRFHGAVQVELPAACSRSCRCRSRPPLVPPRHAHNGHTRSLTALWRCTCFRRTTRKAERRPNVCTLRPRMASRTNLPQSCCGRIVAQAQRRLMKAPYGDGEAICQQVKLFRIERLV